ncbi:MAG: AAA family ATPase [Bacteroidetes bacterium]|nr:MAG: AAA family ATPase [Bacteroidota bacterium]
MELKSITIKNYKSIKEITIPIDSYGEGDNKSSTTILVGLNESGKSSILDIINASQTEFSTIVFSDSFHKGSNEEESPFIDVCIELKIIDRNFFEAGLLQKYPLFKILGATFKVKNVSQSIWKSEKENFGKKYLADFETNITYAKYALLDSEIITITDLIATHGLPQNSSRESIEKSIPTVSFLSKEILEKLITAQFENVFETKIPKIQLWKPKKSFLIDEDIDLLSFMNDTSLSIPLRNIFHINGDGTDEKIKHQIEKALKKIENKAQLENSLSKSITAFINNAWKEHKINIKVRIEGNICNVFVEDKDTEDRFYNMSQRSDGFKQFVSLLLTLSTSSSSNTLSNNIILLDEPETHLHPSGIKYMRDEILKIGKNNHVIVATHSHYMIDTLTPERHFIVSKEKMQTKIEQVDKNISTLEDQVLVKAFGINVFKELLPQNILVVEGGDDKSIISHCFKLLHENFSCGIKPAGGASKVRNVMALLADEQVDALALFDDDEDGRREKSEILKNFKGIYTTKNIYTLKDILSELPHKSTIEDLLPNDFVKEFFEKEMKQDFDLPAEEPILNKIKNQCKTLQQNKSQLDALKIKLSEEFISTFKTKEEIESNAPLMTEFVNNLIAKMQKSE